MSVVLFLLKFVEVLLALVLILLVLLQRSKDDGVGMAFGGAMGESLFGAQAATVLTKGTIWIAALFMLNTVVLDRLASHGPRSSSSDLRRKLETPAMTVETPVEIQPDAGTVPEQPAMERPAVEQPIPLQPAPTEPVQPSAAPAEGAAPAVVPAPAAVPAPAPAS